MSEKSAEYYRGGALDGISKDDNKSSFKKCRLVPRVLRDVSTIAPQTTLFGLPSALPVYISPASNAVLGHPDGELNLTRAAAKTASSKASRTSRPTPSSIYSTRKRKRTSGRESRWGWCIRST